MISEQREPGKSRTLVVSGASSHPSYLMLFNRSNALNCRCHEDGFIHPWIEEFRAAFSCYQKSGQSVASDLKGL